MRTRAPLQAEDADRAAERAQAAQGQRAEALSRLQDVHRQKARHLKDSVEAVQQVGSCPALARPLPSAGLAQCNAECLLSAAGCPAQSCMFPHCFAEQGKCSHELSKSAHLSIHCKFDCLAYACPMSDVPCGSIFTWRLARLGGYRAAGIPITERCALQVAAERAAKQAAAEQAAQEAAEKQRREAEQARQRVSLPASVSRL